MEPFSKAANMTTGGIARGGKLSWDGEQLRFANHAADAALTGKAEWTVGLGDITTVDLAPRSMTPAGLFNGGMRARLRILTSDGQERLFVINGAKRLAEQLDAAASARGDRA